jgi:hypothetical protein
MGLAGLSRFLADLVDGGLARLDPRQATLWNEQAARLVDAGCPGLAARLKDLARRPRRSPAWPLKLLADLGRIQLAIRAFERFEDQSPGTQGDLRQYVGWAIPLTEILAHGDVVTDSWLALGTWTGSEDRLRVRRTWLIGRTSQRTALVQDYAAGRNDFDGSFVPGRCETMQLAFYPSASPLRCRIAERVGKPEPVSMTPAMCNSLDELCAAFACRLAEHPWLDCLGGLLAGVIPQPKEDGSWMLIDRDRKYLPLVGHDHWRLLAISGGHAVDVFVEYDGEAIRPLTVVDSGEWTRLCE